VQQAAKAELFINRLEIKPSSASLQALALING
jgi:hypothetical protein